MQWHGKGNKAGERVEKEETECLCGDIFFSYKCSADIDLE